MDKEWEGPLADCSHSLSKIRRQRPVRIDDYLCF